MRLHALIIAAALTLPLAPTASALELPRLDLKKAFRVAQSVPTVPPEWAGIWQITDSTFTCTGIFLGTDPNQPDTLCTGLPVTEEDPSGQIELNCSGTVTADEVHVTCTGSGPIDVDCDATVTSQLDGTRNGDTYDVTLVVNVVTTGTGVGCGSAFCQETRTHGVRVEPEPVAYCSTQTTTSTWGRVKVLYR